MQGLRRTILVAALVIAPSVVFDLQADQTLADIAPSGATGREVSFGSMPLPISEQQLTDRADVVVDALVTSKSALRLADDPDLPTSLDIEEQEIVDAGYRLNKWSISVVAYIKGSGSNVLTMRRGLNGESGAYLATLDDPSTVVAGKTYRVWLTTDEFFANGDFVMAAARELTL